MKHHILAPPRNVIGSSSCFGRVCVLIELDSRLQMQQWWTFPLGCRRRRPYVELDGMSADNFTHWRRFAKKLRHICKLGRYMAYIGHYLNELRIIGERPSRAEIARRRRANLNPAVWQPHATYHLPLVPTAAPGPAPRADPEPEPQ